MQNHYIAIFRKPHIGLEGYGLHKIKNDYKIDPTSTFFHGFCLSFSLIFYILCKWRWEKSKESVLGVKISQFLHVYVCAYCCGSENLPNYFHCEVVRSPSRWEEQGSVSSWAEGQCTWSFPKWHQIYIKNLYHSILLLPQAKSIEIWYIPY